jgi:hypothetical protein
MRFRASLTRLEYSSARLFLGFVQQGKESITAALEALDPLVTLTISRRVPHLIKEVMGMFSKKRVNY